MAYMPIEKRNDKKENCISWNIGAPFDPEQAIASQAGKFLGIKNITIAPQATITSSKLQTKLPSVAGKLAAADVLWRFILGIITYKSQLAGEDSATRASFSSVQTEIEILLPH
jgi:hypothetical protein